MFSYLKMKTVLAKLLVSTEVGIESEENRRVKNVKVIIDVIFTKKSLWLFAHKAVLAS